MGNCSCLSEKEKHDVTIEAGRRITEKGAESEVKIEVTAPKEEAIVVDFRETDVGMLQSAIRSYLTRKHIPKRPPAKVECNLKQPQVAQSQEAVKLAEEEDPDLDELLITTAPIVAEGDSSEFHGNPEDLLSPPVKLVLSQLQPFDYSRAVKGTTKKNAIKLADGSVYVGEWYKNARFGRGRLYCVDGSFQEGYWKNGVLHYKGRVIYSSGDYYEGHFNHNVREGEGKLVSIISKSSYEGGWKDDKQHGFGTEHFTENNSTYTGEFEQGVKQGKGEFMWGDGSKYNGDFKDNKLDGQGHYVWADKREYIGSWQSSQMHGKGKFLWPDGRVYEGDYSQDKKEGFGVYHWENGKIYEGQWLDGKMHGEGFLTVPGKPRKKYAFVNGKKGNPIDETN